MSPNRPWPRKTVDEWLALSIEEREAIVAHYGHGCRDCERRTSLWTDSEGNRRCHGCWGVVVGRSDESDVAA